MSQLHLGFDAARLDAISGWMQSYVDTRKFAGSSVLVKRGGKEALFSAVGRRNIEEDLPFTRDTVVRIYSMTKLITSTMLMKLAERGLFHLEAPVSDFIPAFSEMNALVRGATRIDQVERCATPTLHHLLTHTSGLSYPFNPGVLPAAMAEAKLMFASSNNALDVEADRLAALPLAFKPGQNWEYSVSIDVLGRVIEVVTGQTLDAVFKSEIFEPLGMKDTSFTVSGDVGDAFASLYTPLPGDAFDLSAKAGDTDPLRLIDQHGKSPYHTTTCFSGGGGLVGTIDDYSRFGEMLLHGGALDGTRILSPKTVDFMARNHLAGDIASMGPDSFAEMPMEGMGFGLGGAVVLDPARARTPGSVGDFGWGGMASTYFWMDPVHDLTVVFFTQLSPSSSYPNRSQLKAMIHAALIE